MLKYVGNSALMDDIGPVMYETPVNYCYAVKCDKCGKTTWKGCGAHVESVSLVL